MKRELLAAVGLALLLVSCGGTAAPSAQSAANSPAAKPAASAAASAKPASSQPAKPAASGLVTWKAGTQHVATDAPLYIAQEKGFFKAQGLNVEFTDVNNQEAIPAVSTGQLDSSVGAIYSSLFNAVARGVEIRAVATKGSITETPQDKP